MASKINSHLDKFYEKIDKHKNFVVNGGAGSGKTYALIQSLKHIFSNNPKTKVACITYTNVAVNEINLRQICGMDKKKKPRNRCGCGV